jgi:methylase of polypeptide subunit release factors
MINQAVAENLTGYPKKTWPGLASLAYFRHDQANQQKLISSKSFQDQFLINHPDSTLGTILQAANQLDIDSLKKLENVFENSLENSIKKQQGAVYTPDFIIDFILEQTISSNNLPTRRNPILDPACGSGGFLVRAAAKLAELMKISFSDATQYLCGIDINPDAIANAKLLMDIACIDKDQPLSHSRFIVLDSLLTDVEEQFLNLEITGGVTALVTNPPYVKLQNLEEMYSQSLLNKYGDIASGAFTLASLFLYNAPKYLTDNGLAGFITLNNVFTSLSAKNLRDEWKNRGYIKRVIDFRHFLVFDASAYTCLVFLGKSNKKHFDYNAVSQMPSLETLRDLNPSRILCASLNSEKWRLGDEDALRLINAMETKGNQLSSIAEIKVGFATLRDKAFIGQYRDSRSEFKGGDGILRIVEEEATQSFLKVSELDENQNLSDHFRPIIYPYEKTDKSRPLIGIEEFSTRFPIAFQHLESWKEYLATKTFADSKDWHQWGRRQSLVSNGPKLLTKTFDYRPNFRLDTSDSLFCNGYSVKPKNVLESYRIEYLKKFLESRFVYAYALITSFEISGGFQCYQKNFIERLCLPPISILEKNYNNEEEFEKELGEFYGFDIKSLDLVLSHYRPLNS